jgi:ATP-binding cassette subfamily F protein 3
VALLAGKSGARPARPAPTASADDAEELGTGPAAERARLEALGLARAAAEAQLARLEEELADPSAWNDPRAAKKSTARHAEAKARVEALYAELEAVAG